ncbi:acyl-CoA thioesterase [Pseudotenacibaculum sp. MALMAid0570]|uniref:acyl-CoA thioesterase n=1 Tax=Pseudotenacibaculum sp. MALMAid0570 TaxID=3143938 RepID=UPI0032DE6407
MKYPKTVESSATIRFQDCDPFNHLNNASYINYFMNHREDMLLKHYDIDIYKMAKISGKSWVVGSNQIAYLRPAFLMEEVVIQSELIKYDASSLLAEMRMYTKDKTQLKAIFWVGFVHFDLLTQKKHIHSQEFMELFSNILLPKEETLFEERVHSIKSKMYHSV